MVSGGGGEGSVLAVGMAKLTKRHAIDLPASSATLAAMISLLSRLHNFPTCQPSVCMCQGHLVCLCVRIKSHKEQLTGNNLFAKLMGTSLN